MYKENFFGIVHSFGNDLISVLNYTHENQTINYVEIITYNPAQ